MAKMKKILMLSSIPFLSTLLLAAKCTDNIKSDNKSIKLLNDKDFEQLIKNTDISKITSFIFGSNFGPSKPLDKVLPTEIEENPSNLKANVNEKYANSINVIVNGARTQKDDRRNISNTKGEVDIFVTFVNKATNKEISKEIKLTGLASNSIGADHRGAIAGDPLQSIGGESGLLEYHKLSHLDRFNKKDNPMYMAMLKNILSQGGLQQLDIKKTRGLNISDEQIKEFDQKAHSSSFDSYISAALKGFTVPVYEGSEVKLKVLDDAEVGKGPSPIDTVHRNPFRSNGLARTLLNETYKTIAEQTYQVSFTVLNTFEKEKTELRKLKEKIGSWNQEQINSFTFKDRSTLKAEYEFRLQDLEAEKKKLTPEALRGVEQSFADRKKKLDDDYKRESERLEKITKEQLQAEIEKKISEHTAKHTTESGTMWLMDFMLPENGKTATKFYFGTNSHVARVITGPTHKFSMTRLNENVGVGSTLRLSNLDDRFTKFLFDSVPGDAVNVIFQATDFLESKPADFLEKSQAAKFKDVEEFMDFAVIEIDFEKVLQNKESLGVISNNQFLNNEFSNKYKNTEELIKLITNNYQSKVEKHIKFKSGSYLKDYDQIDRPIIINNKNAEEVSKYNNLESLYILGYPLSVGDYFLENYIDEDQQREVRNNFSMWINADDKYYKNVTTQEGAPASHPKENLKRGEFLSYEIGYRSFIDKPGLTDGFIAASRTGSDLYSVNGKKYFNYGLHLMPRSYVPMGGASGSSVRNKKNELIGVFHTANSSAKTGLAAVFRSFGYDYKGLLGSYKLPAYDLIYGGAPGQKNSYRQALEKKYQTNGKTYKTNLFKEGVSKENIPAEFEFPENSSSQ